LSAYYCYWLLVCIDNFISRLLRDLWQASVIHILRQDLSA